MIRARYANRANRNRRASKRRAPAQSFGRSVILPIGWNFLEGIGQFLDSDYDGSEAHILGSLNTSAAGTQDPPGSGKFALLNGWRNLPDSWEPRDIDAGTFADGDFINRQDRAGIVPPVGNRGNTLCIECTDAAKSKTLVLGVRKRLYFGNRLKVRFKYKVTDPAGVDSLSIWNASDSGFEVGVQLIDNDSVSAVTWAVKYWGSSYRSWSVNLDTKAKTLMKSGDTNPYVVPGDATASQGWRVFDSTREMELVDTDASPTDKYDTDFYQHTTPGPWIGEWGIAFFFLKFRKFQGMIHIHDLEIFEAEGSPLVLQNLQPDSYPFVQWIDTYGQNNPARFVGGGECEDIQNRLGSSCPRAALWKPPTAAGAAEGTWQTTYNLARETLHDGEIIRALQHGGIRFGEFDLVHIQRLCNLYAENSGPDSKIMLSTIPYYRLSERYSATTDGFYPKPSWGYTPFDVLSAPSKHVDQFHWTPADATDATCRAAGKHVARYMPVGHWANSYAAAQAGTVNGDDKYVEIGPATGITYETFEGLTAEDAISSYAHDNVIIPRYITFLQNNPELKDWWFDFSVLSQYFCTITGGAYNGKRVFSRSYVDAGLSTDEANHIIWNDGRHLYADEPLYAAGANNGFISGVFDDDVRDLRNFNWIRALSMQMRRIIDYMFGANPDLLVTLNVAFTTAPQGNTFEEDPQLLRPWKPGVVTNALDESEDAALNKKGYGLAWMLDIIDRVFYEICFESGDSVGTWENKIKTANLSGRRGKLQTMYGFRSATPTESPDPFTTPDTAMYAGTTTVMKAATRLMYKFTSALLAASYAAEHRVPNVSFWNYVDPDKSHNWDWIRYSTGAPISVWQWLSGSRTSTINAAGEDETTDGLALAQYANAIILNRPASAAVGALNYVVPRHCYDALSTDEYSGGDTIAVKAGEGRILSYTAPS